MRFLRVPTLSNLQRRQPIDARFVFLAPIRTNTFRALRFCPTVERLALRLVIYERNRITARRGNAADSDPDDRPGCAFTKALAEFGPERDEPEIRSLVDRHFSDLETFIARLLKEVRPRDVKRLTQPLVSLICETIVVAQATGKTDVTAKNKEVARALLAE